MEYSTVYCDSISYDKFWMINYNFGLHKDF